MQSLLGQFYHRIRGSQEDIASESLVYLLGKSKQCRGVIEQFIRKELQLHIEDLTFTTQSVGDQLERPDVSGVDVDGNERVLIEAKFWASLTKNQPNTYVSRLGMDSVLMFLVPAQRRYSVYQEVKERLIQTYEVVEDQDRLKFHIVSEKKFVIIKSWPEVLDMMKSELIRVKDQMLLSDINQLIGFCDTIDQNAFMPLVDEDLAPSIPRRINSYYEIVDKVVDKLRISNDDISIKGLVKTPQRYGYHRYFKYKEYGVYFALKLDLWESQADTPFWLSINDNLEKKWTTSNGLRVRLKKIANSSNLPVAEVNQSEFYLGLKPKLHATEDQVIAGFVNDIMSIFKNL